jgi:hypothetical protein
MRIVAFLAAVAAVCLAFPAPARADPWFDARDGALEDLYADGDVDGEDPIILRLGSDGAGPRGVGVAEAHGESWVSLVGFTRALRSGKNDVGAQIVLGLALDRLATGSAHRLADPPPPSPPVARPDERPSLLPPAIARACVAAAFRASGLGAGDERIDAVEARARASAVLPETRLRVMRLWTDASHATTLATTDATDYYAAIGANLVLEGRLTWRLDRTVYAGDEPTLERVRLERAEARAKLAERTLQSLFAWARAGLDAREAPEGSREQAEALLRVAEAEATLDVLTGGWFSDDQARRGGQR